MQAWVSQNLGGVGYLVCLFCYVVDMYRHGIFKSSLFIHLLLLRSMSFGENKVELCDLCIAILIIIHIKATNSLGNSTQEERGKSNGWLNGTCVETGRERNSLVDSSS